MGIAYTRPQVFGSRLRRGDGFKGCVRSSVVSSQGFYLTSERRRGLRFPCPQAGLGPDEAASLAMSAMRDLFPEGGAGQCWAGQACREARTCSWGVPQAVLCCVSPDQSLDLSGPFSKAWHSSRSNEEAGGEISQALLGVPEEGCGAWLSLCCGRDLSTPSLPSPSPPPWWPPSENVTHLLLAPSFSPAPAPGLPCAVYSREQVHSWRLGAL